MYNSSSPTDPYAPQKTTLNSRLSVWSVEPVEHRSIPTTHRIGWGPLFVYPDVGCCCCCCWYSCCCCGHRCLHGRVNQCGTQCCHGWSKTQGSQRCTKREYHNYELSHNFNTTIPRSFITQLQNTAIITTLFHNVIAFVKAVFFNTVLYHCYL